MRQIVYALTGSETVPPVLDRMLDRFAQRVRDEFEDIVWSANFRGSIFASSLFDAYSGLDDTDQLRLFLRPEFYDTICKLARDSSDSNLELLLELLRSAGELLPEKDGSQQIRFHLGGTITVDVGSEYCRRVDPTSPVFMAALEPMDDDEIETVRTKLGRALAEIDETAPGFARLIRNYTRTIFVRKVAAHVPASEQVDTELGAIRLRNVHSELYHHDQLVDDLIHESTHNFLGTFEYLEFPFNPYGRRAESWVRPVSPWSMRSIQALPFIHACFVYFAMFHYAERRRASGLADPDQLERLNARQNRHASGFLMPGRLSSYVSSLAATDGRVCQAIDWMEGVIGERYKLVRLAEAEREELRDVA
jgi:hypothetical protein